MTNESQQALDPHFAGRPQKSVEQMIAEERLKWLSEFTKLRDWARRAVREPKVKPRDQQ